MPRVINVSDPAKTGAVSRDGTIGYADALFGMPAGSVSRSAKDRLGEALDPARNAGLEVELGGTVSTPPAGGGGPGEVVGVVVAFVVLEVALSSLVAAGLPLVTALVRVGGGVLTVRFLSRFIEMTNTPTVLAPMIGLAVGIDYALFIVFRHREQLAGPGQDVPDSIGRATGAEGSAVIFAGVTVIAALATAGVPFLNGRRGGAPADGGVLRSRVISSCREAMRDSARALSPVGFAVVALWRAMRSRRVSFPAPSGERSGCPGGLGEHPPLCSSLYP